MTWGHTCVDCAHLADKESGQSEECATCAQTVDGGRDNWTPRRECKTCNYKNMAVNMAPCNGCIHNPEYKGAHEDADDYWIIADDSANGGAVEGMEGESAGAIQ